MKVFWLFNHPAPYKVDFFNILGQSCEITAVFERAREKGRNASFYKEKPEHFNQIICSSLPLGGVNNWTRKPVGILRKEHFDIVVLNGWFTFTEQHTIAYCKKKKIPYIFYINGGIIPAQEAKWKYALKRRNISGAYCYLCPDENSKQYLIHYGAEEKRIFIYPYSSIHESSIVEHLDTYAKRKRIREAKGYDRPHLFVSCGQFIPRKNYESLISLWAKLPEEYGLLIIGEGPLKEQYETLIASLHLQDRVHLSDYLPHETLLETFRFCDGFVFSSKEDIYGHVINEALSQGLPVVSSKNVNAAKHLIEDGKNGFLVDIENEEEYLSAITSIHEDMRSLAVATAKKNTMEGAASFHLRFFEALLGGQQ